MTGRVITIQKLVELLQSLPQAYSVHANTIGQTGNLVVLDLDGAQVGYVDLTEENYESTE